MSPLPVRDPRKREHLSCLSPSPETWAGGGTGGRALFRLHVEGTIRHPAGNTPWEYSVTITIRNQKGEEVARQMVGIGSMSGNDLRTFDLSVDVFAPEVVAATPAPQKVAATVGAPDLDR